MKIQKRFTLEDRIVIEEMLKKKHTSKAIAKAINRNHETVRREIIVRKVNGIYNGSDAHKQCTSNIHVKRKAGLSDEQKKSILELFVQGVSLNNIAKLVHCGRKKIIEHLNEQRVELYRDKVGKNYHRKVRFTAEDRVKIEELIKEGYANKKISELMERSNSSVRNEITRAGGRDKYNGIERHNQIYTNEKDDKKEKKSDIESRLSILEMQLEILIESVNKLLEAK